MRSLAMDEPALKDWLDVKFKQFASPDFIATDPISIPHQFKAKEDREIAGFLTATLSWGQRPTILKNAQRLLDWMDNAPHDFILHHTLADVKPFSSFVHRTFNGTDCLFFLSCLRQLYTRYGCLEQVFLKAQESEEEDLGPVWFRFRRLFCGELEPGRTGKHLPNPLKGAAAKRWNMWLRWMVRPATEGVDFGIWKKVSPACLHLPLDLHSGKTARTLGLLHRKQDDWKAVRELTLTLRRFDPADPCKYDYALYGAGVFERF